MAVFINILKIKLIFASVFSMLEYIERTLPSSPRTLTTRALLLLRERHCRIYKYLQSPTCRYWRWTLSKADDFYLEKVSDVAFEHVLDTCAPNTQIIKACLGNKAGTIGAVSLVFQSLPPSQCNLKLYFAYGHKKRSTAVLQPLLTLNLIL